MAQKVLVDKETFEEMLMFLSIYYLMHPDAGEKLVELNKKIGKYESKILAAGSAALVVVD